MATTSETQKVHLMQNTRPESEETKLMFMNSHSEHMRLYHGSNQVVEKPVILEPNRRMDFGRGFYTTQSVVQAEKGQDGSQQRRNGYTDRF